MGRLGTGWRLTGANFSLNFPLFRYFPKGGCNIGKSVTGKSPNCVEFARTLMGPRIPLGKPFFKNTHPLTETWWRSQKHTSNFRDAMAFSKTHLHLQRLVSISKKHTAIFRNALAFSKHSSIFKNTLLFSKTHECLFVLIKIFIFILNLFSI